MSNKLHIGLILGGTPMNIGSRNFPDVTKLESDPKPRNEVADALYGSLYDALVNCDEDFVDVVAYKADTSNPIHFRITDKNEHEDDLRDIKEQLIDGKIDVVDIKPKYCVATTYIIVPVHGGC